MRRSTSHRRSFVRIFSSLNFHLNSAFNKQRFIGVDLNHLSPSTVPKPPTKLKLVEDGKTFLKLSTTIPGDDKQCQSAVIEFTCNDKTVIVNASHLQTEYVGTITALNPFKTFNCSARVKNNVGASESTDVEMFATMQDGEL